MEDKLGLQHSLNQILQKKVTEIREANLKISNDLIQASNMGIPQPQTADSHLIPEMKAQVSRLKEEAEVKDRRIAELEHSLSEAFAREDALKRQNSLNEEAKNLYKTPPKIHEASQNGLMTSSLIEDPPVLTKHMLARLADLEKANRGLEADKNLLILELDTRQSQVNEAREQVQRHRELIGNLQKDKSSLKDNLRENEKSIIELRLLIDSLQTAVKETDARNLELSYKQSTNFESGTGADGSTKDVSKSLGNASIKESAAGDRLLANQALSKDSRDSFERAPKDLDEFRKENEELKKTIVGLQESCSDQQARIQVLKQSCIDFEKKLIIAKVAKDELENESQISNAQKKMLSFLEKLLCSIFTITDSQEDLSIIRQQVEGQKRLFEEEKSKLEAVQRRKSNSSDSIFKIEADSNNLGKAV